MYRNKLVLTYNYQHGTQTITLQEVEDFLGSDLVSMSPPEKMANSLRKAPEMETFQVLFFAAAASISYSDFSEGTTLMVDAEIYVDRIADMRIHDMNAVFRSTRQIVLAKHKDEEKYFTANIKNI